MDMPACDGGSPSLTETAWQQMAAWNETVQTFPHDLLVPQLIAQQARLTPDTTALVAGDQTMSYAELNRRANQLAHHLQALGAQPDTIIGICVERSCDLVVGLLGILKAGGAYLPIDLAFPAERIAFMLKDAQVPILVTQQKIVAERSIATPHIVCLDTAAETLASQQASDPDSKTMPADLAYVVYTSGSTGQPKGVMIEHRSLLNLVHWHRQAFAVTAADRATQLASPAFDAAGWELWPHLTAGASVYLVNEDARYSATILRDWLIANQITSLVPPLDASLYLPPSILGVQLLCFGGGRQSPVAVPPP